MRLPQELCDAVVDCLTPEDHRPTLLNCTLVNHFFAVRAQKILFRTISLGRPSTLVDIRLNTVSVNRPSHRFLSILNSSPHLAAYVKEVYISDKNHNTPYREKRSWIRQDTVLHTILDKLDSLRGLSIAGNIIGNRLNFKAWHKRLKDVILDEVSVVVVDEDLVDLGCATFPCLFSPRRLHSGQSNPSILRI